MMSRSKMGLLVIGALALILTGTLVYRYASKKAFVKVMSTHDRVADVVKQWSNMSAPPADNQQLQVIWSTSGRDFGFYPEAAQDLALRMQHEFREGKKNVLGTTDIFDSGKNPAGSVKTVLELSRLVRARYEPE
jgi:hypothetical protein